MRGVRIERLGVIPYGAGVALQEDRRERVATGMSEETLLLLEHEPVYTRGRRSTSDELPLGDDFYRARGLDVVTTDRGGKVTYHGPGQLVGYPIMRSDDVLGYLRTMEKAIVAALSDVGVGAHPRPGRGFTGVWVQERKIASIGVHISRGVTTHGFAVNVDNDLEPFGWVVPCGMPEVRMTSVAEETGRSGSLDAFRDAIARRFCEAYSLVPVGAAPAAGALAAS